MKTKTYDLIRTAVLVSLFFNVFIFDLSAKNPKPFTVVNDSQPSASVKYIGMEDGYLYFQIELSQPTENRSILRINDQNGYALYKEEISAKSYTRRFKVERDEVNNLEFVFITKQKVVKKSFTINVETIEKVDVKEVESVK